MSDDIKPLTATATFTRKVNDGNYGSQEAGIFVQFDFTSDSEKDEIAQKAHAAFRIAKAVVLNELGIEFKLNESGLIEEVVERAFPGTTNETPVKKAEAPQAPKPAFKPVGGGAPGECAQCGGTSFYDNRADKASGNANPKSPDLKCKQCKKGVWLR